MVLAVGFLAVASPRSILGQSEVVEPPQLTRYTVPTTTWATPISRGFLWFYSPEIFEKTRPLFGYKLSQIYFDNSSLCSLAGIAGDSQYDAGTVALVYMGQEYDGFQLGSTVDRETLETLGSKVAMSRVLEEKGFDVETDFQDAEATIVDFIDGLPKAGTAGQNVVDNARAYYNTTWIPSSPTARNLIERMIRKAEKSDSKFNSETDLSKYWREQATKAAGELALETSKSTKMLQFIANAVKTDKTRKLTLTQLCKSSDFIASRRQTLGDNFLFVTKQPLPKVVPNTRLKPSQIIIAGQNETPRPADAQARN